MIIFLNPSLQVGSLNASGLIKLSPASLQNYSNEEKHEFLGMGTGAEMYTNTGTHFSFYFQMSHQTKLSGQSGLRVFLLTVFLFSCYFGCLFIPR